MASGERISFRLNTADVHMNNVNFTLRHKKEFVRIFFFKSNKAEFFSYMESLDLNGQRNFKPGDEIKCVLCEVCNRFSHTLRRFCAAVCFCVESKAGMLAAFVVEVIHDLFV